MLAANPCDGINGIEEIAWHGIEEMAWHGEERGSTCAARTNSKRRDVASIQATGLSFPRMLQGASPRSSPRPARTGSDRSGVLEGPSRSRSCLPPSEARTGSSGQARSPQLAMSGVSESVAHYCADAITFPSRNRLTLISSFFSSFLAIIHASCNASHFLLVAIEYTG